MPRCMHSWAVEMMTPPAKLRQLRNTPPTRVLASHPLATRGDVLWLQGSPERGGVVSAAVADTGVDARFVYHVDHTGRVSCRACRRGSATRCAHIRELRRAAAEAPNDQLARLRFAADERAAAAADARQAAELADDADYEPEQPEHRHCPRGRGCGCGSHHGGGHGSGSDSGSGGDSSDTSDGGVDGSGRTRILAMVSWRERQLHEEVPKPVGDGVLPDCYWCRAQAARLAALQTAPPPPALAWTPVPGAWQPDAADALARAGLRGAAELGGEQEAALRREVQRRLDLRAEERWLELSAQQRRQAKREAPGKKNKRRRAEMRRGALPLHEAAQRQMDADVDAWWRRQRRGDLPWLAWLLRAVGELGCRHCVDEPEPRCCDCCSQPLDDDPVGSGSVVRTSRSGALAPRGSVLYMERGAALVTVYRRACSTAGCGGGEDYDGKGQGVFNHTDASLYRDCVLRDYWDTFHLQHGKSAHAYHAELRAKYLRRGGAIPVATRNAFS